MLFLFLVFFKIGLFTFGADKKVQFSEPVEDYNTISLVKFAFSILWQAVKHSEKYGTVIIFDF